MIVASHQPNFMPYMGFFYKMYVCDIFTLSNTVQFTRQGFHNYNFFDVEGKRTKISVPVSNHSGKIQDVKLANWEYNRKKIWERLRHAYAKAPYFKEYSPIFEEIFMKDYSTIAELNIELIKAFKKIFGLDCKLVLESDLAVSQEYTATGQIADICIKTGCDTYLSGLGAIEYLDELCIKHKGGKVLWSNYRPLQYGELEDLSVFDYIMNKGAAIPEEWKARKEELLHGRI